MPNHAPNPRTEVRRKAQRAHYDFEVIKTIIDEALICHIAFNHGGGVHCLPTGCWREGEFLYIHGAGNSRLMRALLTGECAVCVTHLDGLVLARSAFHHSMNYRSAVIYGRFSEVEDPEDKKAACAALIEFISPGRSALVRAPNAAELSGTLILRLSLAEAVAKIRDGGVEDAEEDLGVPVWAGVVPLAVRADAPLPDSGCGDHAPAALPAFIRD